MSPAAVNSSGEKMEGGWSDSCWTEGLPGASQVGQDGEKLTSPQTEIDFNSTASVLSSALILELISVVTTTTSPLLFMLPILALFGFWMRLLHYRTKLSLGVNAPTTSELNISQLQSK